METEEDLMHTTFKSMHSNDNYKVSYKILDLIPVKNTIIIDIDTYVKYSNIIPDDVVRHSIAKFGKYYYMSKDNTQKSHLILTHQSEKVIEWLKNILSITPGAHGEFNVYEPYATESDLINKNTLIFTSERAIKVNQIKQIIYDNIQLGSLAHIQCKIIKFINAFPDKPILYCKSSFVLNPTENEFVLMKFKNDVAKQEFIEQIQSKMKLTEKELDEIVIQPPKYQEPPSAPPAKLL